MSALDDAWQPALLPRTQRKHRRRRSLPGYSAERGCGARLSLLLGESERRRIRYRNLSSQLALQRAATNRAPFSPADTANWYNSIFNYAGANPMPLRPVAVARNPVSNFSPSYFNDRGTWSAGVTPAYAFGDRVQYTYNATYNGTVEQVTRGFVCIAPGSAATPGTSESAWAAMPWSNAPDEDQRQHGHVRASFGPRTGA